MRNLGSERPDRDISSSDDVAVQKSTKPRLLFFRSHGDLPAYILSQLDQHVKCLSIFFDVRLISEGGNYQELCDRFQPDLTLVESGVYGAPPLITNRMACPEVPKLGLLNADAYCPTRSAFLVDMERWGIETFFTISVSMPEYLPGNLDRLFIWPNFVDPQIYRDYGQPKNIPVLTIGSRAMHYPWRTRINELAAQQFPSLVCPHFGWFDPKKSARMVYDEEYAKLINASCVVPTCGTVAREVVRKHFEIPACNSCLVTERTSALEDAGFVDMQNCVFASESDVLQKLEYLFANPDVLEKISNAGRRLVHSRHTSHQRDQIFQWYTLNKARQSGQRIVQTLPFGPLALVGEASNERNYQSSANGVDRAILKEGHWQLERGNYDAADRAFLRCLNYHRMPEPFLGLTLSALKKGDPGGALQWISRLTKYGFEVDRAIEPDPIEWSYFIIALLCNGNVREAAKRVDEFPSLQHSEIDRCRWAISVLNGATSAKRPSERSFSRSSIHHFARTSIDAWIEELCETLRKSRQEHLARRLLAAIDNSRIEADAVSGDVVGHAVSHIREPLSSKIRRRAPEGLRRLASMLRARTKRVDAFASTVSVWAQKDQISSALLLGASDSSTYTRAFLAGVQKNPLMPRVLCVGAAPDEFKGVKRQFGGNGQIQFSARSLLAARRDVGMESFDLIFVDRYVLDESVAAEVLGGAKTVLVRDLDTPAGHAVVTGISEGDYQVAYDRMSRAGHSTVFTRPAREISPVQTASRTA